MYVNVKLLNGFSRSLTYKIPATWDTATIIGTIVTVPLQKRTELAFVTELFSSLPAHARTLNIREVAAQEKIPGAAQYARFIGALSQHYLLEPLTFYQRLKHFLKEDAASYLDTISNEITRYERPSNEVVAPPLASEYDRPSDTVPTSPLISSNSSKARIVSRYDKPNNTVDNLPELTDEQQICMAEIAPLIDAGCYAALLLQGVTGSGKTEIYKRSILRAYAAGKSVLFLVPEVSLAVQFTAIFKNALADCAVFGFHSATSAAEKRELWNFLTQTTPVVIVGVHLPLLLPIANLGLIIIDEEHDVGYQEKKHPKINTKEAALLRALTCSLPVVLGSATPSLQSLHNVATKKWRTAHLTKRFAGAFPRIKVVPLAHAESRRNFWISRDLEHAIGQRLVRNEQIIIFLNRRGYSFFVQCSACGFVCECRSCSVSLTLHEDGSLRCHYCSYHMQQPERCPRCTPKKATLIKKGIGTQQVVSILQTMFPAARIARADLDTTVNKKKWQATIAGVHDRTIDILVGTQTITKGHHFPGVTLVGILWADINLHIPFYNAAETTLQQLIQVAGRAGRQSPESLVIVQSMVDHPLFQYLDEQRYTDFYAYERAHRAAADYPPCTRFAEIELRHNDEATLERESKRCAEILADFQRRHDIPLTILGPARPPVHKIKNVFSRKIYLKSPHYTTLQNAYRAVVEHELAAQLFFTPNPLQ